MFDDKIYTLVKSTGPFCGGCNWFSILTAKHNVFYCQTALKNAIFLCAKDFV